MGYAAKRDVIEEFHQNYFSFGVFRPAFAMNDPIYDVAHTQLTDTYSPCDPISAAEHDAQTGFGRIHNDGSYIHIHKEGRIDPSMSEAEKKQEEEKENPLGLSKLNLRIMQESFLEDSIRSTEAFFADKPIYTSGGTKIVPYRTPDGKISYYDDGLSCLVDIPKDTTVVQSLSPTKENVAAASSPFVFTPNGEVSFKPLLETSPAEVAKNDELLVMTNLKLIGPDATTTYTAPSLADTPPSSNIPDERDAQVARWAALAETKADVTNDTSVKTTAEPKVAEPKVEQKAAIDFLNPTTQTQKVSIGALNF